MNFLKNFFFLSLMLILISEVSHAQSLDYLMSEVSQEQRVSEVVVVEDTWIITFDWPLMNAVLDNDVSLARTLIEDGADVNYYYDSNGVVKPLFFTPLSVAAHSMYAKMVDLLIAKGADVDLMSPLVKAIRGCYSYYRSRTDCTTFVLEKLIQAGADVNYGGETNYTPLMEAARNSDVKAIEVLIQAGADPYIVHNNRGHFQDGYTAIRYTYNPIIHDHEFQDRLSQIRFLLHTEMTRRENTENP